MTSPTSRPVESPLPALEVSPPVVLAAGAILVALIGAVFWEFFWLQARIALEYPADWGHILVIPFISAWFVWLRREELARRPFAPAWTGLFVLVASMLWYFIASYGPEVFNYGVLQGAGAYGAIVGVVLLVFGWRAMRWLWFPLAYLACFAQSVPRAALELVTLRLQDWAARGAFFLLNGIGIDTDIAGNTLTVFGSSGDPHPLNVSEACSGMRMVVAFLALGVAMAFVGLDKWWQRAALVLAAVPVAVAVNILRVATLGVLSLRSVNMIQGEFHIFVGMLWLIPGFLLFLGIQWSLRVLGEPMKRSAAPAAPRATTPINRGNGA